MSQLEQEKLQPQRVHLGALVDREQRDQLVRLAQEADRSVSATVRLALAGYLNRETED
jgi:predicted transcriptional regulator